MKQLGILIFFLYFFSINFSQAQRNAQEYETQYLKALLLYQNNEFDKAKLAFAHLSDTKLQTVAEIQPYAYYFNALCSIKLGKWLDAKLIIQNLQAAFPTWEKKDEVAYLSAHLAFEDKNYSSALFSLQSISDTSLLKQSTAMKGHYLSRLKDTKVLYDLLNQFPEEATLKAQLQRYAANSYSTATELHQYRLNKGYLNFALLFPINVDELNGFPAKRNNQYVLDMYQGATLAKNQLLKENIKVNLQVYDLGNDADEMLELMNNPYFQLTDLMIGPLYAEPNRYANIYGEFYQVPLVNPISNNIGILDFFDKSFLAQPSSNMQAVKGAEYMVQKSYLSRNIAIFYGPNPSDSSMAESYKKALEAKDYTITAFQKVNAKTESIARKLPDGRLHHVFLASNNQKIAIAMLNALTQNGIDAPLLTTAEALSHVNLNNTLVNGRELYCLDPEFIDANNTEVEKFQKDYLTKYGVIPSYYAFAGYDITLFWGRVLSKSSTGLKKSLSSSNTYKGLYLLGGYNYIRSQDNQTVPITTFDNYKFVKAK